MLSRLEISQSDFDELTAFIKEKYGLDLARKKSIVESRLSNYVLDCGFNSFSEYLSAVYSDETGRETANLINRLTTNHTYFMRETDHFQHFMAKFLPYAEKTSSIMICVYGVQAVHSATNHIILPCVWTIISALTAVSGT